MADGSCDDHVGYIIWLQTTGSRKIPVMPSSCLLCPEVAISKRISLYEDKNNASNQPCESSNTSPDHCRQEFEPRWPWECRHCDRGNYPRTHLSGSRLSWPTLVKDRSGFIPMFHPWKEKPTSFWVIQQSKVVGCCSGVQALTIRGCCVITPAEMLAVEVANIQDGLWKRRDGRWCESQAWRFVDVDDLIPCDSRPVFSRLDRLLPIGPAPKGAPANYLLQTNTFNRKCLCSADAESTVFSKRAAWGPLPSEINVNCAVL